MSATAVVDEEKVAIAERLLHCVVKATTSRAVIAATTSALWRLCLRADVDAPSKAVQKRSDTLRDTLVVKEALEEATCKSHHVLSEAVASARSDGFLSPHAHAAARRVFTGWQPRTPRPIFRGGQLEAGGRSH